MRHVSGPMWHHTGDGVSHLRLEAQVEVRVMGKFEGQHIQGIVQQDILPDITCFIHVSVNWKNLSTGNIELRER